MCRWFAYISPEEPALLSDLLITPANSIAQQCSEHYLPGLLPHDTEKRLDNRRKDALVRMRNSLLNIDGLGIAYYTKVAESYMKSVEGRVRRCISRSSRRQTTSTSRISAETQRPIVSSLTFALPAELQSRRSTATPSFLGVIFSCTTAWCRRSRTFGVT